MPPRRSPFFPTRGTVETAGEAERAALLARAWRRASNAKTHPLHILHPWPARLPPAFAAEVLRGLRGLEGPVLDPFCGSGTVAVEAVRAGRVCVASDVHPVATFLSRVKTEPIDARLPGDFERSLRAWLRRARDLRPEVPFERYRSHFPFHAARDLAALVAALPPPGADAPRSIGARELFSFALSAVALRFSRRRFETDTRQAHRLSAPPLALFAAASRKAREALRVLFTERKAHPPKACVLRADARSLPLRTGSIGLVLTSPPYPGTYAYADLAEPRARILGLDGRAAARLEIGRRLPPRCADAGGALSRWRRDYVKVLREVRRVLDPEGCAVLVLGDALLGELPVDALAETREACREAGLRLAASATQHRPRRPPRPELARSEHALWLEPDTGRGASPSDRHTRRGSRRLPPDDRRRFGQAPAARSGAPRKNRKKKERENGRAERI